MTITDLRCDICGIAVPGPAGAGVPAGAGGVQFAYHPGDVRLRDQSGLLCERCWEHAFADATPSGQRCAICASPVTYAGSLHVRRLDTPDRRQLCRTHAIEFLNRLRTVQPKLDPATFQLPLS